MNNKALEINKLSVKVGEFQLKDISFSVDKGTVMGLIGKNGAGKTTLIKSIINQIQKNNGEIKFDGLTLKDNEVEVKRKIGIVFDSLIYPLGYKPKKIVKIYAPFYDEQYTARFNSLMERFELDPNKKLMAYSKGMQMRFSVVMALAHNPEFIILDEPTAGLDPVARADVLDCLLEQMQDENKSVLFSTHITSDLEKISDYITLIDNGEIMFSEEKDSLLDKFNLVSLDKSQMSKKISKSLMGLKESAFGFTGLTLNKKELVDIDGVKMVRPTIEDLMIYFNGKEGKCNA